MARECAFSSACQVPQRCSRSRLPLLSRSTVKGHATKQSVLPSGLFRDGLKTGVYQWHGRLRCMHIRCLFRSCNPYCVLQRLAQFNCHVYLRSLIGVVSFWAAPDSCHAEIHDGIYGEWSVDDTDIAEVLGYRAGIILCALCSAAVFGAAGVTDEPLLPTLALNSLCLVGTASFATSLVLIHIYVTEIKRTIQV